VRAVHARGGQEDWKGAHLSVVELHDLAARAGVPQPHRVVVPPRRPHLPRRRAATVSRVGGFGVLVLVANSSVHGWIADDMAEGGG
jgi:hypothetical protein